MGRGQLRHESRVTLSMRRIYMLDPRQRSLASASQAVVGADPALPGWADDLVDCDNDSLPSCQRLAEQGNAKGEFLFGRLMYNGVPSSEVEGLKWFFRSAQQGYAPAQNALGSIYLLGEHVLQ